MDNLLAAEGLIRARLVERMPELRVVRGVRSLDEATVASLPAAFLLYDGQEGVAGAGLEHAARQLWRVVVAVRNLRDPEGNAERQAAGALLGAVVKALLGWSPGSGCGPLTLASAERPAFGNGVGYYPLRFATRIRLTGEP